MLTPSRVNSAAVELYRAKLNFAALATPTEVGVEANGMALVGILTPTNPATAVTLEVEVSDDGDTWHDLGDETGADVTFDVTTATAIQVPPSWVYGWRYVRVVLNAADTTAVILHFKAI